MIRVTRLNHTPLVLNSDLIEQVESTPDTIISLTSGQKIRVLESSDEIVDRVITFRRQIVSAGVCGAVPLLRPKVVTHDHSQDLDDGD